MRLPTGAAAPRLAALTATLNRMLERIEGSFLRQRHFMRDVAEELRDPVAMLRVSVAELPDGAERDHLRDEIARIARVVDDMTSLARADAPGFIRRQADGDRARSWRRSSRRPSRCWASASRPRCRPRTCASTSIPSGCARCC